MNKVVRFRFDSSDPNSVEDDLRLALFSAGCLFGPSRLRLETNYLVREDGESCVIESRGEAGDAATRIFAGLTAARVGDEGFVVEPADGREGSGTRSAS